MKMTNLKKCATTIFILSTLFSLSACQTGPKLSPMQKRQITTRVLEGTYNNAFGATMTVLQDHEYVIKQATKETGLITAEVSRDSGFWAKMASNNNGISSNAGTQVEVSATFSKLNPSTTEVRLAIQEKVYNSVGGVTRSKQILEQEVFQTLFNDIKVEVKRREAFGK